MTSPSAADETPGDAKRAKARATRERLLDSFEEILMNLGAPGATLEAVAAGAGVSKGGLLYHFAGKDALVEAQIDRLWGLYAIDKEAILTAPEGSVRYYLRTSIETDSPYDRAIVAAIRLAQNLEDRAITALDEMKNGWRDTIQSVVGDPDLARTICLLGTGLYESATIRGLHIGPTADDYADVEAALAILARLNPQPGQ